jgi:hypothetical protein
VPNREPGHCDAVILHYARWRDARGFLVNRLLVALLRRTAGPLQPG